MDGAEDRREALDRLRIDPSPRPAAPTPYLLPATIEPPPIRVRPRLDIERCRSRCRPRYAHTQEAACSLLNPSIGRPIFLFQLPVVAVEPVTEAAYPLVMAAWPFACSAVLTPP